MAGRKTNVFCLVATILITIATTVVMGIAVLSDYWEQVVYSRQMVESIATNRTAAANLKNREGMQYI
jgi:hypothetical protein